ncbi:TolC family protein [Thalassotalea sp. PLHSN55]|uniref:TolC family protein n=1 Tax=Thalassotalea sp. PLHSN55 TaxID=3435888 RepID=UPI003F8785E4
MKNIIYYAYPQASYLARLVILVLAFIASVPVFAQPIISLQQAINLAHANDPWLHGSELQQSAQEAKSIAAATFADPKVSLTLANVPADSWDLNQEAMSQVKLGISQQFPRGDVLAIKQSKLKLAASKYPLLRAQRKAKLTAEISQLWLDAFLAQQTIALINKDKTLFEQLVEVATAGYSSTLASAKQQDVIRAQLELIQLDDRLTVQRQKLKTTLAQLNEWLHVYQGESGEYSIDFDAQPQEFKVSSTLPTLSLSHGFLLTKAHYSRNEIAQALAKHPAVLAIDIKQDIAKKDLALANEQYKPQWGMSASYALRNDTPAGDDRADLFSLGLTFDMPIFKENRQDKWVSASYAQAQAVKTEKLLVIKNMLASVEKEISQLRYLSKRQALYQQQLIQQTHQQAEASLTAYTNDTGDFSDVVRARIVELNTAISALEIKVNALKTVARINYFFTKAQRQSMTLQGEN